MRNFSGSSIPWRRSAWLRDRLWQAFGILCVCGVVLSLLLPQFVVVLSALNSATVVSFPPAGFTLKWFSRALANEDFRAAALNSSIVALTTALIAGSLGTVLAYSIERFTFRGRRVLDALLGLPLLIPHFTLGLGFLIAGAQFGMMRTFTILIAAHVILVLPFVMRSVHVSMRSLDNRIPIAAASLGARPLTVFFRIELPLLMPGILSGFLLAAILSFSEFTGSLFLVGRRTETLPVAMYNYVRDYSEPTIAAMAGMMILGVIVVIAGATWLLGLRRVMS